MADEPLAVPHCSLAYCDARLTGCDLGIKPLANCPHWKARPTVETAEVPIPSSAPLPWAGASLGTDDLSYVAVRSAPRLIGIIGPHNAGKTTLLIAWYLLLSRGLRLPERLFAGSCSLGGWEDLAHWLRWPPGAGPMYPPHTALHDGPQPGLLHFAFRRDDGYLEDVLLTDAPGEWFTRWAVNRDEALAEGARWTVRNADAFVVVVDRGALAGKERGVARSRLFDLAGRLSDERAGRPVAIVWTKSDVPVDSVMEAAVREHLQARLPDSLTFAVSVHGANQSAAAHTLLQPLCDLIALSPAQPSAPLDLVVMDSSDAFLRYRGK